LAWTASSTLCTTAVTEDDNHIFSEDDHENLPKGHAILPQQTVKVNLGNSALPYLQCSGEGGKERERRKILTDGYLRTSPLDLHPRFLSPK
jgi:hypothetical protein